MAELHDGTTHFGIFRNQRTDTDTAFRIAFGDRIDQYHVLLDTFQMTSRDIRGTGIDKLPVYLIREKIKIIFLYDIPDLIHLTTRIQITRRIVRVTDQDRFGTRSNQTGYLYTQKEMDQIRDIVKKYDLFLFSDEVYREFCYTGAPYISAFHLKGIENNVVLVDSVSKRYSECGIRIGALITKNQMVKENVMKWCQARLSPPLVGQIIAEASLDTPEDYMLDVYNEYVERRKFLIDGLNRIPGCYSPIPMGAFYTVAKLPVDDADKFCAWCLDEFEYEGQTVMMAPASGFYTTPGLGKNEVRIAYVLKKEDLAKALVVLAKALEAYPGRVI